MARPDVDARAPPWKRPDAFRTISELADELDLPQHVLRFWGDAFLADQADEEVRRPALLPAGTSELVRAIRRCSTGRATRSKGVQKLFQDNGVRAVVGTARTGRPLGPIRRRWPSPRSGEARPNDVPATQGDETGEAARAASPPT